MFFFFLFGPVIYMYITELQQLNYIYIEYILNKQQFLVNIFDSPQTTCGRIGEWASSNLQPCWDPHKFKPFTMIVGFCYFCQQYWKKDLFNIFIIISFGKRKQKENRILKKSGRAPLGIV